MRTDFIAQANTIKTQTTKRINGLVDAGARQVKLYCAETDTAPAADSGVFAGGMEEWEVNRDYEKNDLFSYNGNMGFVKQAHTSQSHWLPFSQGTEALYGARPNPDADGVYPYTYHMAADVGMLVRDPDDGLTYECIQVITDMLFKPHEIPAHFTVKSD